MRISDWSSDVCSSDLAAKAAAAAFPAWAATSPEERGKFCSRIAEGLGARMDEIRTLVTREAGMPKWLSVMVQAGPPINSFYAAGQIAECSDYETTVGTCLVVKEPVGGASGRAWWWISV